MEQNKPDPINLIKPGVPLTDLEKKNLGEANAKSSAEAMTMAANRRAQDEREAPLDQVLAGSVMEKLKALPPEPPQA